MCYEFSLWSRKLRAKDDARKETPKPEQVAKETKPAPQAQPVATAKKAKERETIPV